MDCKEFSSLLSAEVSGALSPEEAARMRDHAAACPECAARWALRQDLKRMEEEIEVPEGFSSAWKQRIREEEKMEEKKTKAFAWKKWIAVAAALVFVVGGTLLSRDQMPNRTQNASAGTWNAKAVSASETAALGLGAYQRTADTGAANFMLADAMEAPMEAMESEMDDYASAEAPEAGEAPQEKIIRNASFTIKTDHYDDDLARLQALAAEAGGRVEYLSASGDASSGQTRSASLTLRIPAGRLDEFLSGVEGIGNVTAMTQELQDVSESYYDIKTRLETQQKKLERLQNMLGTAVKVSDLIEIESAIADAQYYIDRYTSQLRSYDGKVEYSTVRATVREVKVTELVKVTLGQRIAAGFQDSLKAGAEFLEDMVIFLISALPWLLAVGAAVLVIRLIVKSIKKNKKTARKDQ